MEKKKTKERFLFVHAVILNFLKDRQISATIKKTISTSNKIASYLGINADTHPFPIKIDFIFLYCFRIL